MKPYNYAMFCSSSLGTNTLTSNVIKNFSSLCDLTEFTQPSNSTVDILSASREIYDRKFLYTLDTNYNYIRDSYLLVKNDQNGVFNSFGLQFFLRGGGCLRKKFCLRVNNV